MWRMLVGFLLLSLPPAGGVYPSRPVLFLGVEVCFFFFFPSPPSSFPPHWFYI